jgi:two-component system, NtrC family, sensor kinase
MNAPDDKLLALMRANDALTQTNQRLVKAQEQLMQTEKLAAIGQLAAGVAHEINNPVGYVFSNFGTLERYLADLFRMLAAYETASTSLGDAAQRTHLAALRQDLDIDFLKQDIPGLMHESREGLARVRKIVQDLKDFSRIDCQQEWLWVDLHRGLESTLNIVNHEIKYKADLQRHYGELPEVLCLPSELNQVFMNLLVNAAQAIGEARGTLTVSTGTQGADQVWVEVADTGAGVAPEHLARIFEPFFTTKPVGQGTGLGLSLSYGIVRKHGGTISVHSQPGDTRFRVTLPIQAPEADLAGKASATLPHPT